MSHETITIKGTSKIRSAMQCWKEVYDLSKNHPEVLIQSSMRIVSKTGNGKIIPFNLNKAQWRVMEAFCKQWERNHRVRLVVLKGRQQGISTLSNAIMLWYMVTHRNSNALLMANTQKDLENVHFKRFSQIAKTFSFPYKFINFTAKTLEFDRKGEGNSYAEGRWAQTEGGARGGTFGAVHLTEVDWYRDFDKCFTSIIGSVTAPTDTIILIESTSCGHGNLFNLYQKKLNNESEFEFVFLPWYEQEEYKLPVPQDGLKLRDSNKRLQEVYHLTDEQINWYQTTENSIGDSTRMRHEYPSCIEDCFEEDSSGSYVFDYLSIMEAAKHDKIEDYNARLILGIDPSASANGDETAMVWRKGKNVVRIVCFRPTFGSKDPKGDIIYKIINQISILKPDDIYIDAIGAGAFLKQHLESKTGLRNIQEVCFSGTTDNKIFFNKRAELYGRAANWLRCGSVHIPDDKEFINQLKSIRYIPDKPRIQVEEKDEIRNRIHRSPDIADAFVMTFPYENDITYSRCVNMRFETSSDYSNTIYNNTNQSNFF